MSCVYISRATAVAARSLDGEMMIMSARDSTLFTLNPAGTIIWQSADGKTPLAEIVEQKICAEFEVEPSDALKDAERFVSDLASHGVLVVSGAPIGDVKGISGEAQ
jgi:Coenzyme PQQ synthesis protein D (PqqD)